MYSRFTPSAHVSELPMLLKLNNIPLYVFCLIIHPEVNVWVASMLAIANNVTVNMSI